jgi:hypothetical protein
MEKAIIALKNLVEHRKELISTFRDKNRPWHLGNVEISVQLAEGIADFLSNEVQYLEKVVLSLECEKPKCKHPKKY